MRLSEKTHTGGPFNLETWLESVVDSAAPLIEDRDIDLLYWVMPDVPLQLIGVRRFVVCCGDYARASEISHLFPSRTLHSLANFLARSSAMQYRTRIKARLLSSSNRATSRQAASDYA